MILLPEHPRVGITFGPTRAWIDPVRYLANASTGELGATMADRFESAGARVEAIIGPMAQRPRSERIALHEIETPEDLSGMAQRLSRTHSADPFKLWIHAMAVLDFAPESTAKEKIASTGEELILKLVPTPKVITSFQNLFPTCPLVGFKLLTGSDLRALKESAEELGRRARCDLMVANFEPFREPVRHEAHFWDRDANQWYGPRRGKAEIADEVLRWFARLQKDHVPPET